MAKRRSRSEFRLHVQIADNREQFGGEDVISLQIRRWQLHLRVRQHGWDRFQGQDRLQARQASQITNMGKGFVIGFEYDETDLSGAFSGHRRTGTVQDDYDGVL